MVAKKVAKKNTRSLMRKELGKKAHAILKELHAMLERHAKPRAIENMVRKALEKYKGATIAAASLSVGDIQR